MLIWLAFEVLFAAALAEILPTFGTAFRMLLTVTFARKLTSLHMASATRDCHADVVGVGLCAADARVIGLGSSAASPGVSLATEATTASTA